ncbi:hypothetical protein [Agromyces rhizosphaerae]|uniref:hypothetical protein n=1 Tax=Agromyces rhizosphaerae TaxID=88374 RepID=UPI002490FC0C|nr:hypothetical protein [Agromyces rhizosphaerae]
MAVDGLAVPSGGGPPTTPAGLDLRFGDGSRTRAELLVDDRGRAALDVERYGTAAGTQLGPSLWEVSRTEPSASGAVLVIGSKAGRPD